MESTRINGCEICLDLDEVSQALFLYFDWVGDEEKARLLSEGGVDRVHIVGEEVVFIATMLSDDQED